MYEIKIKDYSKNVYADLDKLDLIISKAATSLEKELKDSITKGVKSGKPYKRGKRVHISSAPGESPATDTSKLLNSIRAKRINKNAYEVIIGALYAGILEFGSSRMKPRPFIIPAVNKISKLLDKVLGALFK